MLKMRVAGANNGTERMIYIFTITHKRLFEKYSLQEMQVKIFKYSNLFNVKQISLEKNSIQVVAVKLPVAKPVTISALSKEEQDEEIGQGYMDILHYVRWQGY